MTTINPSDIEQTGGWFNAQIIPIDEIVSSPEVLTNNNASSIIIQPSADGLDVVPISENITISESTRTNKDGTYYDIRLQIEFPIQLKEIDTYFNNYLHKGVALIGIKSSGQQKMYGSKRFPLEFSYEHINGKKLQDGALIRVTVSGKTPQKPVYIND